MATIRTDQRSIIGRRIPHGDERTAQLTRTIVAAELELARHLAEVDESAHFAFSGCASVGEYGARYGLDPTRARALAEVGKALQVNDRLDPLLRTGELDMARAALAARVLARPGYARPGEDWAEFARTENKLALLRRVNTRFEEIRQQRLKLKTLVFHVPEKTVDDFKRCQQIATNKRRRLLTEGQTLQTITDFYLDQNDPLRKTPRKRRMPDTRVAASGGLRKRHVPAEVRRAVLERSAGRCEVRGCEHRYHLELAHLVAHAKGGAREVDDLAALCGRHHTMYDAGVLELAGWTDAGRPIFAFAGLPGERDPPGPGTHSSGADCVGERAAPIRAVRAPPRRRPPRGSGFLHSPLVRLRARTHRHLHDPSRQAQVPLRQRGCP